MGCMPRRIALKRVTQLFLEVRKSTSFYFVGTLGNVCNNADRTKYARSVFNRARIPAHFEETRSRPSSHVLQASTYSLRHDNRDRIHHYEVVDLRVRDHNKTNGPAHLLFPNKVDDQQNDEGNGIKQNKPGQRSSSQKRMKSYGTVLPTG